MDQPEWVPANEVERVMAEALAAADGARYARALQSAQLLVAEPPEPGSDQEQQVAELLPPGDPYVLAFTSPETLAWALGDADYQELHFAALRQRWPDRRHQLAVNPGSPIATFLPPGAVSEIAEGKQSLVEVEAVTNVMAAEAVSQIRRLCLRDLAAGGGTGGLAGGGVRDPAGGEPRDPARGDPRDLAGSAGQDLAGGGVRDPAGGGLRDITGGEEDPPALADHTPVNSLETALREAVERADGDAYLSALLEADVVLPTASIVADPRQIHEDGFPWRILGGEQALVIAAFSSAAALARTGAGGAPTVQVSFLDLLLSWPGEEHTLCLNPGVVTELVLPGGAVLDLASAVTEALDPGQPES